MRLISGRRGDVIGIDEVGRGPLAGPVAVCALLLRRDIFSPRRFRGVRDSKQLSAAARESWFEVIKAERSRGALDFAVSFVGPAYIDTHGIAPAIRLALARAISRLPVSPAACRVFLDGGLRAPARYIHQKTIIKGDERVLPITLASIAAKVIRDRRLTRLAVRFPDYGFEVHKGYGTKYHWEMIRRHGCCPLHRRSFLRSLGTLTALQK